MAERGGIDFEGELVTGPPCEGAKNSTERWASLVRFIVDILSENIVFVEPEMFAAPCLDDAACATPEHIFGQQDFLPDSPSNMGTSMTRSTSAPPASSWNRKGLSIRSPRFRSAHSGQNTPRSGLGTPGTFRSGTTEDFKSFLQSQGRSVVEVWHNFLDPGSTGRSRLPQFCEGVRSLNYRGSIQSLWSEMESNSTGFITLSDIDYPTAETLGLFHSALVEKYGIIEKACKKLRLISARQANKNEFLHLLCHKGVATEKEAFLVFKILCTLSPDKSHVTERELRWLENISVHLPRPSAVRVQSGSIADGLAGDSSSSEEEENPVFDRLYHEGVMRQQRRDERSASRPLLAQLSSRAPNPKAFERLHNDHQKLKLQHEKRAEQFFRSICQPRIHARSDPERLERLGRPRMVRHPSNPEMLVSSGKPRMKALSERIRNLYEDNQIRQKRLESIRVEAEEKQAQQDEAARKEILRGRRADPQTFMRLYGDAVKKRKQKEFEQEQARMAAAATEPSRTPNPEAFDRLHEYAMQREHKWKEAKLLSERTLDEQLKEVSVHKNAGGGAHVFERLHGVKNNSVNCDVLKPCANTNALDTTGTLRHAAQRSVTPKHASGRRASAPPAKNRSFSRSKSNSRPSPHAHGAHAVRDEAMATDAQNAHSNIKRHGAPISPRTEEVNLLDQDLTTRSIDARSCRAILASLQSKTRGGGEITSKSQWLPVPHG